MIHPTRTNLLRLRTRKTSAHNSLAILKARRQVLIKEFLASVKPFLASRDALRQRYREALEELHLSLGIEGEGEIRSLMAITGQELGVEIVEKNVMGVRCREIRLEGSPVRSPEQRDFDFTANSSHVLEAIHLFETIVEDMGAIAAWENKLRRLGEEIQRVTRRTRVLEERVIPRLQRKIRLIAQYLGEREREAHYRLKLFKKGRAAY